MFSNDSLVLFGAKMNVKGFIYSFIDKEEFIKLFADIIQCNTLCNDVRYK